MYINPYSLPSILSSFVSLALFSFVFARGHQNKPNQIFSILCLETFIWQFSWFISYFFSAPFTKELIARIAWSAIVFIPFTFCHFDVEIGNLTEKRRFVSAGYLFAALFLVLLWATKLFILGYRDYWWGSYPLAGPLFIVYLVVVMFFITKLPLLLLRSLQQNKLGASRRKQIQFVLLAHLVYYLAAIEYLIDYGIGFFPLGVFFILSSFTVLALAITKTRLMDIGVVISRSLAWTITVGFLGGIYLILVWFYRSFVSTQTDLIFLLWSVFYGIVVGETFQRIRLFLQTTSDRFFVKPSYKEKEVLRAMSP